MKAIVLERHGGPEVLRVREVPDPELHFQVDKNACPIDNEQRVTGACTGVFPASLGR